MIYMRKKPSEEMIFYGSDILKSKGMRKEKRFIQHGRISCYEHSVNVAEMSLTLARRMPFSVNRRALVRGALLHDYFLYDWHRDSQGLHGFFHAGIALKNARADFKLCDTEKNIIKTHMFPLNITPPKYRESWIVCIADKICAIKETIQKR